MQNDTQPNQPADMLEPPSVQLVPWQAQGATPVPESRFGERLKYAREQLGLNIEALSRLSRDLDIASEGVSPTSIARYEQGDRLPGLAEFRCLCDALLVPAQWLLYGDIGNAGKDDIEQSLIDVLSRFARAKAAELDTLTLETQMKEDFKKRLRLEAIAKAKKPKG